MAVGAAGSPAAFVMRPAAVLLGAVVLSGCSEARPHTPDEHTALGAAFAAGDSAGLRPLLHPDFLVQPPPPDSASRGDVAIAYLLGLAARTRVSESRLHPTSVTREGPFLLEEGTWFMGEGDRVLRARYLLRWRPADSGWRVVLWRWTRFR